MLELNAWANVLLRNYNNLENISKAIDARVSILAMSSINAGEKTITLTDKILNLMETKMTLCNIKVLIDTAFKVLNYDDARLLVAKFVDKRELDWLASLYRVNKRTILRKIAVAKERFINAMKLQHYDEARLCKELKHHHWLMNEYGQELHLLTIRSLKSKFDNSTAECSKTSCM